jgi:LDH2 family malate/lactate/ureidoglycolate dehydrogenase
VSITLSLDEVYELAFRALTGSKTSDTNARPVADSIRAAEADGFRNGGLRHLPQYCEDARRGRVDGYASATWEQAAQATILVDAKHGFAHAAFAMARQPLVELTRHTGIAAMGLRHSYDAAALGYFVEQLARNGLVALAFANSLSPSMAPWGGKLPFFGTNPMAFAVPRPSGNPMVIDQASSVVARVTVRQHAAEHKPLPPGWAFRLGVMSREPAVWATTRPGTNARAKRARQATSMSLIFPPRRRHVLPGEMDQRWCCLTTCASAAGPQAGAHTNLRSTARSRKVPPERGSAPLRPVGCMRGLAGAAR